MLQGKFTASLTGLTFVIGLVLGVALTLWFSPKQLFSGNHRPQHFQPHATRRQDLPQSPGRRRPGGQRCPQKNRKLHIKKRSHVAEKDAGEAERIAALAFDAAEKAGLRAESATTAAEEAQRVVEGSGVVLDPAVADTIDKLSGHDDCRIES